MKGRPGPTTGHQAPVWPSLVLLLDTPLTLPEHHLRPKPHHRPRLARAAHLPQAARRGQTRIHVCALRAELEGAQSEGQQCELCERGAQGAAVSQGLGSDSEMRLVVRA